MSKRVADKEINHDNWAEEDESEEAGTFQQASEDIIKGRVIKTARRRANLTEPESKAKPIFSGFSFIKTNSETQKISEHTSGLFGNGESKVEAKKDDLVAKQTSVENWTKKNSPNKGNTEFYSKLKGLNESVSQWIKRHVDDNPLCILTPVFKDYERHLSEIQERHGMKTQMDDASSKTVVAKDTSSSSLFANESFKNTSMASIFNTKPLEGSKASKLCSVKNDSPSMLSDEPKKNTMMFSSGSATFSFGNSSTSPPSSLPTAGFSFGTGAPFTFGNVSNPILNNQTVSKPKIEEEQENDEPPKVEFKAVIEEDSVYTVRCKVFTKKDDSYVDGGVGNLFLKPVKDRNKTQLIVRADTNLGNLLINVLLSDSIPTERVGKNNVMMICIPTPEKGPMPTSILLRVKTAELADELLEMIKKYKC